MSSEIKVCPICRKLPCRVYVPSPIKGADQQRVAATCGSINCQRENAKQWRTVNKRRQVTMSSLAFGSY